ncbi:MAG: hypothetical protein V3V08_22335 [Nannocystaceae bacterium]
MKSLRRVWAAPGLLAVIWVLHTTLGHVLALPVRAAVRGAHAPSAPIEEERLLFALLESFAEQPAILGVVESTLLLSLLVAVAFDVVLAGGVITRLHRSTAPMKICSACGRWFLPLLVQTLWFALLRAAFVVLAILVFEFPPLARAFLWLVLACLASGTWPALQLARCRVVLEIGGHRPYHVTTTWRALRDTSRDAVYWAGGASLALSQLILVAALLIHATVEILEPATLWITRISGLVTWALSLWLTALAVQRCAEESRCTT